MVEKSHSSYKKFFEGSWCPFFGAIPKIPANLNHPRSVVYHCVEIIETAREWWGLYQCDNWPWSNPIYPDVRIIEKKIGYPQGVINSARRVFERGVDISSNFEDNHNYRLLEIDIGVTAGATVDPFMAMRTHYGRHPETKKLIIHEDEEFMPHLAFAILAIRFAWSTLREILYYGHKDDSRDALLWIWQADRMLVRGLEAISQRDGIGFSELREDMEATRWAAKDSGAKGGSKSGKLKKEKAESQHKADQELADEIWKKHPKWSDRRVAIDISKKTGGNPDTIRQRIKKRLQ